MAAIRDYRQEYVMVRGKKRQQHRKWRRLRTEPAIGINHLPLPTSVREAVNPRMAAANRVSCEEEQFAEEKRKKRKVGRAVGFGLLAHLGSNQTRKLAQGITPWNRALSRWKKAHFLKEPRRICQWRSMPSPAGGPGCSRPARVVYNPILQDLDLGQYMQGYYGKLTSYFTLLSKSTTRSSLQAGSKAEAMRQHLQESKKGKFALDITDQRALEGFRKPKLSSLMGELSEANEVELRRESSYFSRVFQVTVVVLQKRKFSLLGIEEELHEDIPQKPKLDRGGPMLVTAYHTSLGVGLGFAMLAVLLFIAEVTKFTIVGGRNYGRVRASFRVVGGTMVHSLVLESEARGLYENWGLISISYKDWLNCDFSIAEHVNFCLTAGMNEKDFGTMILDYAKALGFCNLEEMISKVHYLKELGLRNEYVGQVKAIKPQLIVCSVEERWKSLVKYLYYQWVCIKMGNRGMPQVNDDGEVRMAAWLDCVNNLTIQFFKLPSMGLNDVRVWIKPVGIGGRGFHYLTTMSCAGFVVEEPLIIGHECIWIIEDLGSKVQLVVVGNRVTIDPGNSCWCCYFCKENSINLPHRIVHPAGLSSIGLATMVAARAFGAHRIVNVDIKDSCLPVAKKFGADKIAKGQINKAMGAWEWPIMRSMFLLPLTSAAAREGDIIGMFRYRDTYTLAWNFRGVDRLI